MTTRQEHPPSFRLTAALFTVALLAAACGNDSTNTTISHGSDGPPAAGTCLAGTVDCDDTPGDLSGPDDEPTGPITNSGMLVDGGLTVEEALSRTPDDGIIAVAGAFYRDDTGTFLCGILAESFPPLCGAGALRLEGPVDELISAPVQETQGVQWTDETISLFGTVDNGVLTIDPLVTG